MIAIIGTLAAAGFSVGPAIINSAKKTSGMATASAIAMAVEQYYTEYAALPADSDSVSTDTQLDSTTNGIGTLNILAGEDVNGQNPRKIRFLSVKQAKNGIDGAVYTGNSISKIVDPFGEPYFIRLDYDYDEVLRFTPNGSTAVTLRGRRVAVHSLGVKKNGTPTAKTLIKTW